MMTILENGQKQEEQQSRCIDLAVKYIISDFFAAFKRVSQKLMCVSSEKLSIFRSTKKRIIST